MTRHDVKLHVSITEAGNTLLRGTLFVLLATMIVPAFGVLAFLVMVIIAALVTGYVLRPRIRITGNLPERVVAGQTLEVTYELRNIARVPAYQLSIRFVTLANDIEHVAADHTTVDLAPGETAKAILTIRPKRRGHYVIDPPICRSSFPFNLFTFGTSRRGTQTLTVLPPFYEIPITTGRRQRQVHSGRDQFAGHAELSPEYAGSRPFLPGDSPHTIDVRAWARLGAPATKEYLNTVDSFSALILDTRVHLHASRSDIIKNLDAAVSLCASLAFIASRDGHIDMLLAGTDLHEFSSWPVSSRLDRTHDLLAGVQANRAYQLESLETVLEDRFRQISEAMFVLFVLDETYQPVLEWATRAGCHCTVFIVGDPNSTTIDESAQEWIDDITVLGADTILAGPIEHL